MQLVKSLICLLGRDNGERFLAIFASVLLLFFVVTGNVFTAWWAQLIWLVPSVLVIFYTTIRRVRDAGEKAGLAWSLVGLTALACILPLFLPHFSAYTPLMLVVFLGLYIFSLPAKDHQFYTLGYKGPVDLSAYAKPVKVQAKPLNARVEPVLFGGVNTGNPYNDAPYGTHGDEYLNRKAQAQPSELAKWRQDLYQWFRQHKKLSGSLASAMSVLIVTLLAWPYLPSNDHAQGETAQLMMPVIPSASVERNHRLEMPDDFYLMMTEHDGLVIHWQADIQRDGEIWSLASAKGDDTCQYIEFNNGDKVRPYNVAVENGGDYFASFSPLDSRMLVQSLEKRGNFGLCGYNFSLKGSQKALNSHPVYIELTD
ncbi:hypothetical protein FE810_05165 [Thalassotalea litorea]|uniref:DUF805 domain-containing protein n=1 Tax=Thalassotalea litorea TaxID=2020715 RepID=A0A5R9IS52_9GAMM|nr:hypothetical protein [Thalassotalea litorea]TLU66897.1 hypothetical protein FE810_05165 [Thalassotalea litorea]